MDRKIIQTKDGSHTLYVPELNEHYHSTFGAIQESEHIFIRSGIAVREEQCLNVLEAGFGTGLNAILSLIYAEQNNKHIRFHSIEKYPLTKQEYLQLNYHQLLPEKFKPYFLRIHEINWEKEDNITPYFSLWKYNTDFKDIHFDSQFDVVFFDAFNPDVQPDLWTQGVMETFCNALKKEGILVTYCVKGIVKQALRNLGMQVEKLPGPPGKREILRATKK